MKSTSNDRARAYFDELVRPIMADALRGLPYSAGRLGTGSDVVGLDDDVSRDHDWGLRLSLFVPAADVVAVDEALEAKLPAEFHGLPVRFALSGDPAVRHRIEVTSIHEFLDSRLGFDPRKGATTFDWLSLTGQAVLEMISGPVFADEAGELDTLRRSLAWYPEGLWRHVIACDWAQLAQELPLMGRAADVGDDSGSRIIAARLVQTLMHLAFLLERRWPPYAKWFGTMFGGLVAAPDIKEPLAAALSAADLNGRHVGIASAAASLLHIQNGLGLTTVEAATVPFWDRPYLQPNPEIVHQLREGIDDETVRSLPAGFGSIEQRTDNVDILTNVCVRRSMVSAATRTIG